MSDQPAILCFGALHYDCIADCIGPYRERASNPVRTHRTPGGVGHNIARNLSQMSMKVAMASLVGADDDGRVLKRQLDDYGIDSSLVMVSRDHASASYIAVLDEEGELAVGLADMAVYDALDQTCVGEMLPRAGRWPNWIIDANLPEKSIRFLAENKGGAQLYLAPVSVAKAPRMKPVLDLADVMICNGYEMAMLSGRTVSNATDAVLAAESLLAGLEQIFVVTLGPDGAVLVTGGQRLHFPAPPTDVVDVNGAGDSFFSGFAAARCRGGDAVAAMRNGLAKASLTAEESNPISPNFTMEALTARKAQVPPPITL